MKRIVSSLGLAIVILGAQATADPPLQFGEPIQVSAAGVRAMAPDVAVDDRGTVHVIWVNKASKSAAAAANPHDHSASDDLYYSQLPAGGKAFTPPRRINDVAGEVWGAPLSKPQIDVGRSGIVHIMYPANARQSSSGKAILATRYTRSTDGGATFEPARTLNSAASNDLSAVMHGGFAAAHAFGTLTAAGAHDVRVLWIDTRYMKPEDTAGALFESVSTDDGKTFSADHAIYKDHVCPCCQLAAVAPGRHVLLSSRRTFEGGYRDPTVSWLTGNDRFSAPVRLGAEHWKIEGCPLKRTAIAADGSHVYAAWFTASTEPNGVYFARSVDGGLTYGRAVSVHPAASISDAPTMAANSSALFLAWHAKAGTDGDRRIYMSASTDGGATLSEPVPVPTASGIAEYPELAAGGDGTAYLAWQQADAAYVMRVTTNSARIAQTRP